MTPKSRQNVQSSFPLILQPSLLRSLLPPSESRLHRGSLQEIRYSSYPASLCAGAIRRECPSAAKMFLLFLFFLGHNIT